MPPLKLLANLSSNDLLAIENYDKINKVSTMMGDVDIEVSSPYDCYSKLNDGLNCYSGKLKILNQENHHSNSSSGVQSTTTSSPESRLKNLDRSTDDLTNDFKLNLYNSKDLNEFKKEQTLKKAGIRFPYKPTRHVRNDPNFEKLPDNDYQVNLSASEHTTVHVQRYTSNKKVLNLLETGNGAASLQESINSLSSINGGNLDEQQQINLQNLLQQQKNLQSLSESIQEDYESPLRFWL